MQKISFLIVNYFTSKYLKYLIESIVKNIKNYDYEILIYDNSCNKVEESNIEALSCNNIRIFNSGQNDGFVRSNNILFKNTNSDLLVLINPDALLIDTSIEKLFNYLLEHNEIAVAGPMLLNEDMSYQVSFFKFPTLISLIKEHIFMFTNNVYAYKTDVNKMQFCDVVKGACLVLNRKLIMDSGVFDEDFVMYSEETDLCFRMKNLGKKVLYYPETKIIHYGEKSSSHNFASEYSLYHYYRSKLILYKKHYKRSQMTIARMILIISLLEKSVMLVFFNRKESSLIHRSVLRKIKKYAKDLSNL